MRREEDSRAARCVGCNEWNENGTAWTQDETGEADARAHPMDVRRASAAL
jgi:hypothetical protein